MLGSCSVYILLSYVILKEIVNSYDAQVAKIFKQHGPLLFSNKKQHIGMALILP